MPAEFAAIGVAVPAILAAGVVAVIAVALAAVALHRASRLTPVRGGLSIGTAVGISALTVAGLLAVT